MTLEEFAKQAGCIVSINPNPEGWGGEWMYTSKYFPNSHVCGLKTEQAAYKSWLRGTFGEGTAKAVINLLKKTEAQKEVRRQKKIRRPAVRLSDVEVQEIINKEFGRDRYLTLCRAIEAAVLEKNGLEVKDD